MGADSDRVGLRRAALVRSYDAGETTVVLGEGGDGRALGGDSARLARAVLELLEQPRSMTELVTLLEHRAGAPLQSPEQRQVIESLVGILRELGAIEPAIAPRRGGAPHKPGARVVLGLTGAVATMHAPALVQALLERGHHVRVAATAEALRWVRPESLEVLTHRPVASQLWTEDRKHLVPHIELARWADAVLVYPASATTLGRIAHGDYSSIVSAIALTTTAPVMLAPSMNAAMYASAAVQRNLAQLVDDSMHVVRPTLGIEVADAPDARTPTLGAAPPPKVVLQLLETMLAQAHGGRVAGHGPEDWDAMYRRAAEALPWHSDRVDDDLAAAIATHVPAGAAVLDVGTGLGTLARHCAAAGHRVVATDLSAVALERAAAIDPDAAVVWLQDDVTDSHVRGRFDAIVDRGCLHLLTHEGARRHAASMARLLRPGGVLLLKTFGAQAAATRGTTAYDRAEVLALLGDAFALHDDRASTMPGPDQEPPAHLFVLRRREA